MNERNQNGNILKWYQWIRLIGITLAVYLTMEYVLPVVLPFCIGFAIAFALYPLRRWIQCRLHLKRESAGFVALLVGICTAVMVVGGILYLLLLGGSYAGKCGLPDMMLSQGRTMWNTCCDRLHTWTGRWVMEPEDYGVFVDAVKKRSLHFDADALMSNWKHVSTQTLRGLAYVLVTIVSALLMLSEFDELKKKAGRIAKRLFHAGFGLTLRKVGWTYVKAQMIIIGTITGICVLGLLVARERYWLLTGVAIGICDALPFLGTGVCFLPWALWRLLSGRYVSALWFVVLYMITSFTRQSLEPKLIGKKIGVPPLAVLISVYVGVKVYSRGGFLLGPISAFLIWQLYSDDVAKEDANESDETADGADDTL
ncbi:MAG: AI-2E family transporter [Lachnospiraceae bacterium]